MHVTDDRYVKHGVAPVRCRVEFARYHNGQLAIQLIEEATGEDWCTPSLAMAYAEVPQDCVAIKNYSELEGMPEVLARDGVIEKAPVKWLRTGFVQVPVYRLTAPAIEESKAHHADH